MRKIIFPEGLYPWQKEILEDIGSNYQSDQFILINSPRQRFAKSTTLALLLIKASLEKVGDSIYIAPTIQQCRSEFEDIIRMLDGSGFITQANASILEITFINKSKIYFRSAAADESIRGMTASLILCFDEANFISREFIMKALPLRSVHNALTLFVSTPTSMSGLFWELFNDPKVKVYNWSKYVNQVYSEEELQRLKELYPKNMYLSEILGQFYTSGGLLFQNINDCIKEPKTGQKLYIGIDLSSAVGGDYTAITVINQDREVIAVKYDNKLEPAARIDWIADYLNSLQNVSKILVETNNMGLTVIDLLKRKIKYPITKWTTTEASKRDIIQSLQLAFENKTIGIVNDQELIKELQSFGCKINPKTGKMTYEGINSKDDLVMSLAIALKGIETGNYSVKIW